MDGIERASRFSRAVEWILATRLRKAAAAAVLLATAALLVTELTLANDHGFFKEFLERLLEALLIAGIISLVLDEVAKVELAENATVRVQEEWQRVTDEGLWALLNQDAWPQHKEMVVQMAEKKTFLGQGTWTVTVEDDPEFEELVRLLVEFEGVGQTFEPPGRFPYGQTPLLASSDKRTSRHLTYKLKRIEANGRRETVIDADEATLNDPENQLTKERTDGAIVLSVESLKTGFAREGLRFAQKDQFELRQSAAVYRHRRGFFPMWLPWTCCETNVKVIDKSRRGELQFTLARLDQLKVEPGLTPDREESVGLLPPGCPFFLSWSRLAESQSE